MSLWIRFKEGDKPVTRVMDYSPDASLASVLAMLMVVLQNCYRLFPALAFMLDAAGMKVAVVAVVAADRADAILSG